ncbi:hypothetical protein ABK040_005854 [Willaertia magna]
MSGMDEGVNYYGLETPISIGSSPSSTFPGFVVGKDLLNLSIQQQQQLDKSNNNSCPPLGVPEAFGIVEEGIYRSRLPHLEKHFQFLKTLSLKTILFLSQEIILKPFAQFLTKENIQLIELGLYISHKKLTGKKPLNNLKVLSPTLNNFLNTPIEETNLSDDSIFTMNNNQISTQNISGSGVNNNNSVTMMSPTTVNSSTMVNNINGIDFNQITPTTKTSHLQILHQSIVSSIESNSNNNNNNTTSTGSSIRSPFDSNNELLLFNNELEDYENDSNQNNNQNNQNNNTMNNQIDNNLKHLTVELVKEALEILLNKENHPILVVCSSGVHLTGTVIGCLRKIQDWSLTSIFTEYECFAGNHSRHYNQQFIEMFDTGLIALPSDGLLPNWLLEHYEMNRRELLEMEMLNERLKLLEEASDRDNNNESKEEIIHKRSGSNLSDKTNNLMIDLGQLMGGNSNSGNNNNSLYKYTYQQYLMDKHCPLISEKSKFDIDLTILDDEDD